jgi:hypothetical protein
MNRFFDLLLVLACNVLGFFSIGLCLFIAYGLGLVAENSFQNHAGDIQKWFIIGTQLVWLACAAFSLSGLFVKNNSRYVLILSPAYMPLLYGLCVLLAFAGKASS